MKICTYTASLWSISPKSAAACPNVPTSKIQKEFRLNFVLRICTTSTWMKFVSPNPLYITPPNNLEAKTPKMMECSSSETSVTVCHSTRRVIKNLNLYFFYRKNNSDAAHFARLCPWFHFDFFSSSLFLKLKTCVRFSSGNLPLCNLNILSLKSLHIRKFYFPKLSNLLQAIFLHFAVTEHWFISKLTLSKINNL